MSDYLPGLEGVPATKSNISFIDGERGVLAYRGRFDAATPGNSVPVTGADLRAATDALIAGKAPAAEQAPSMGCSIKWKRDRAPSWA